MLKTSRRRAALTTLLGSAANTLIISLQGIILVPLYLQALGDRLYGAWLGSGDALAWMQSFDLGLPNLMIQRIGAAHAQGDEQTVGEYFATGTLVMGLVAVLILVAGLTLGRWIPAWTGVSGTESVSLEQCFDVGVVATAIVLFNYAFVAYSRGVQETAIMNAAIVASSLIGFVVALALLVAGWNLWAIAVGMIARALALAAGSFVFIAVEGRRGWSGHFRIRRYIVREMAFLSPATTVGGLAYAVMSQSEGIMVAVLLGPQSVPVLVLTRRGADVLRGLLDMIAFAAYGSFAHLVKSDQRRRALQVHAELTSLRLSLAVAAATAYLAVNASFVAVWVGPSLYGGPLLTALIALQMVVVGSSFLMNYLYRACGPVAKGSIALAVEGLVRVPLAVFLLLWLGLIGIPLASIVTSAVASIVAYRWTQQELSNIADRVWLWPSRVQAIRLLLLAVGLWTCWHVFDASWLFVLIVGGSAFFAGGAGLLLIDPLLTSVSSPIPAMARRVVLHLRTRAG